MDGDHEVLLTAPERLAWGLLRSFEHAAGNGLAASQAARTGMSAPQRDAS
jgi:hypothetical protein